MKIKTKKIFVFFIIFIFMIAIFLYWQNNDIVTTNIVYKNTEIPQAFNDYKIVQISDLHNKTFGSDQHRLIAEIQAVKPDLIVTTGDLIDADDTNISIAVGFASQAVNIAPVYYVSGNHEEISGKYDELKIKLTEVGAVVLDNDMASIEKNSESIDIIGLSDVGFYAYRYASEQEYRDVLKNNLVSLLTSSDKFSIVLSHRPEFMDDYTACKAKLVLSGHAHGGQVRLPVVGGLYAPGQGLFPEYTSGSYVKGAATMVVSRGLGNSIFPFRILNRPEIIVVTLRKC